MTGEERDAFGDIESLKEHTPTHTSLRITHILCNILRMFTAYNGNSHSLQFE